jgi:Tfp pilus assembly pilus retraction ATPase PilT
MSEPIAGLPPEHLGEVVVVTGMTGAGRSTAA